jgi:hypothetical protein
MKFQGFLGKLPQGKLKDALLEINFNFEASPPESLGQASEISIFIGTNLYYRVKD